MEIEWVDINNELPKDREKVICGHKSGQWVVDDVLFMKEDNSFRQRVNAGIGGENGYKSKETKLLGPRVFPTHWMKLPNPPMDKVYGDDDLRKLFGVKELSSYTGRSVFQGKYTINFGI